LVHKSHSEFKDIRDQNYEKVTQGHSK